MISKKSFILHGIPLLSPEFVWTDGLQKQQFREKVSSDWLDTNGSEATSKEARVRWLLYTHVTMISAENFRISL